MKKSMLALLLAVLMLLPLGACANPAEPPVEEEPTRDFVLKEGNTSAYSIVFPTADQCGEVSAAYELYNSLGGSKTDGLKYQNEKMASENKDNPDAFEIVIGDCGHEQEKTVAGLLERPNDYVIYTQNNRIFIYSRYYESTMAAVKDLVSRVREEDGKKVVSLPEKVYHEYAYPAKGLKIAGNPIENYVIVVPEDSERDDAKAEKINQWLLENVGVALPVCGASEEKRTYEILIGDTGRAEDTVTATLAENAYKVSLVDETRLLLAYNGFGKEAVEETLNHFQDLTLESWSAEGTESAYSQFRYDNFADGKMSDELLDSVSPGVLSLLSDCMYYEAKLQEGLKQGQKWVYSNSSKYVPQSGFFDDMLKSGKYGANCAMAQAWVLVDMKIITNGKHVWGGDYAEIKHIEDYGKYMTAVGTIYQWNGTYSFKDLYQRGKIEPGDIFYVKGHTFIFLGDEKFMATGHDSKWHSEAGAPTDDSQKCVFDTWVCNMKSCGDYNYSIHWIYRFDENFVPKTYRNAEGQLVRCPLYDESTSMYYKAGVSSEEVKIVKGSIR